MIDTARFMTMITYGGDDYIYDDHNGDDLTATTRTTMIHMFAGYLDIVYR